MSEEGSVHCRCAGGKFWNGTKCSNCAPGTYKNEDMSSCEDCSSDSVSQDGAINCLSCPPGSTAVNNKTACRCPSSMVWSWSSKTAGTCSICPTDTYKNPKIQACIPCPAFSITRGTDSCICLPGTYKSPNMTSCTLCPLGTSSKAGAEYCACQAGDFWNGTNCQACPRNSASQEGALKCVKCPEGTFADKTRTSCFCLEGLTWKWEGGGGSCASPQRLTAWHSSKYFTIAMLAGLFAMVVINIALGLLLLCRRRSKGRKEIAEAPTVAYKKEGEVLHKWRWEERVDKEAIRKWPNATLNLRKRHAMQMRNIRVDLEALLVRKLKTFTTSWTTTLASEVCTQSCFASVACYNLIPISFWCPIVFDRWKHFDPLYFVLSI